MIICFVDIGGIYDHHCLNFLFINILLCKNECVSSSSCVDYGYN